MVEYSIKLNNIFQSLADETRRDILRRVCQCELSIGALAESYSMSFAAVAKHIAVLEAAGLVLKRRSGKQQIIAAVPEVVSVAQSHLSEYQELWESRFEALNKIL